MWNPEKIKTALEISKVLNILLIGVAVVLIATSNPVPWWLVVAIVIA